MWIWIWDPDLKSKFVCLDEIFEWVFEFEQIHPMIFFRISNNYPTLVISNPPLTE